MKGKLGALEEKFQEKEGEVTLSKEDNKVIQERLDSFKKRNNVRYSVFRDQLSWQVWRNSKVYQYISEYFGTKFYKNLD